MHLTLYRTQPAMQIIDPPAEQRWQNDPGRPSRLLRGLRSRAVLVVTLVRVVVLVAVAARTLSRRSAILVVGAIAVVRLCLEAAADRLRRYGQPRRYSAMRNGQCGIAPPSLPRRDGACWEPKRDRAPGLARQTARRAVDDARLCHPARASPIRRVSSRPDVPASVLLGAGALRVPSRDRSEARWRWAILCGAAVGLGLLAKYAMFYFVLGAAVAASSCRRPAFAGFS